MAISKILTLGFQSAAADTIEIMYTSPAGGLGTDIEALTVANDTTTNQDYKVYLYDSVGTGVGVMQPLTTIVRDRFSSAPGVINHTVPAGGTVRVESSSIAGLKFTLTGIEQ